MFRNSKKTDGLILFQQLWWTIFIPIAGLLGYMQYIPIDSKEAFWTVSLFGLYLVFTSSVPIKFPYDPLNDEFINDITGERISRKWMFFSRGAIRGIGLGMICWAVGDKLALSWSVYEMIAGIIAIPIIINGIRSYFKNLA